MIFTVYRTSGDRPNVGEFEQFCSCGELRGKLEISTIGDLLELMRKCDTQIVMSMRGNKPIIEIYDSYKD